MEEKPEPTFIQRHSTALNAGLLAVATVFPFWAGWQQHDAFLNDDTYITFAYAKNLVAGNGFTYNQPPPTFGTTTPLFTLIIALLARLIPWVSLQSLAVFFTAACWAGIPWVIFWFRRHLGLQDWQAGVIGLAIIATGWVANLGMESYLFALLLMLTVALYYRGNRLLCGLTTGLLFLTRGEGVIILALLIATDMIKFYPSHGRSWPLRLKSPAYILIGFALPVTPWLIYAKAAFGSYLPTSLSVKILQGQLGYIPTFSHEFMRIWLKSFGAPLAVSANKWLSPWWLLVAAGLVYILFRNRRWLILIAWIAAYLAAYAVLGVADYSWYRLPVLFVLQIIAALGLVAIMILFARVFRQQWLRLLLPVCLLIPYVLILGLKTERSIGTSGHDIRGPGYTELSSWLRINAVPDETVAVNEVGYFGYYTENGIVDLSGLVTPDAIPALQQGDLTWTFWHYEPDYMIYIAHYESIYADIMMNPEFGRRYQAVTSAPSPWENENDLVIYKRR